MKLKLLTALTLLFIFVGFSQFDRIKQRIFRDDPKISPAEKACKETKWSTIANKLKDKDYSGGLALIHDISFYECKVEITDIASILETYQYASTDLLKENVTTQP